MNDNHEQIKCRKCGTTVAQCRCFDHTKTIRWVEECEGCARRKSSNSNDSLAEVIADAVVMAESVGFDVTSNDSMNSSGFDTSFDGGGGDSGGGGASSDW